MRIEEVGARHVVPTPRRAAAPHLVGVAIIACGTAAGAASSASPATPKGGALATCDIAPRSLDEIGNLLANSNIATPAATTGGQTLPSGIPVSTEAADTIEAVVQTWLACQNGGEPLRAWALFSDGYLYRLLARQGMPTLSDSSAAMPESAADGGADLLEIRDERELPDGRFGATVVITYPSVPMPKRFFFYFTESGGQFLIDGILGEISFSVP